MEAGKEVFKPAPVHPLRLYICVITAYITLGMLWCDWVIHWRHKGSRLLTFVIEVPFFILNQSRPMVGYRLHRHTYTDHVTLFVHQLTITLKGNCFWSPMFITLLAILQENGYGHRRETFSITLSRAWGSILLILVRIGQKLPSLTPNM